MVARELHVRYRDRPDLPQLDGRQALQGPGDAMRFLRGLLQPEPVEVMVAVMLTVKFRPICFHEIGRGSLSTVIADPRDVFKAALLANAGGVIVSHNHPSGDPAPSPEDLAITRRLAAAGSLLSITLVDHIVIGSDDRYFSFSESGLLSGF